MIHPALRPAVTSLAIAAVLVTAAAGGMAAAARTALCAPGAELRANSTAGAHIPFRDGPPARVTGGFGEDSCYACHWDGAENDEAGSLTVDDFPDRYEAGAVYDLEVAVAHPNLEVAGFQLAVRRAEDGAQAGRLQVGVGEEDRVRILTDREIDFAHHLLPGIEPSGGNAARWGVRWMAPEVPDGAVLLHVSAVAGDGDDSQMGDAVYTIELESRPR